MTTTTYSLNFNFPIPPFDALTWYNQYVQLVKSVDALIAKFITVNNFQGSWANSTAYTAGQSVFDPGTGHLYQCVIAHTSASSGTMAADIAAHPTYWTSLTLVARARGAWATSTVYAAGDFVYSGNVYAVALTGHTSSSSFSADSTKWGYLIDATASVNSAANSATTASSSASAAATSAGNALTSESNAATSASTATTQASNAATSASAAAASASAAGQANCNTTSTTNITIATGATTFFTDDVRPFQNQFIKASSAADNTKWMFGNVTGWDGVSELDVNITATNGSGAVTDWQISSVGPQGPGGGSGLGSVSADTSPSLGGNLNVAGYSIVSASNGDINIVPNGTGKTVITGLKFNSDVQVNGYSIVSVSNGNITITPNGTGKTDITGLRLVSDLLVNGNRITSTSNATIKVESQGSTGGLELKLLRKYQEYCPAIANSGTAATFDCTASGSSGSVHKRYTLNGNATITLNGTPDTNGILTIIMLVVQDGTGGRTLAFATDAAGGIDWGEAVTMPSHNTTANKSTEYVFTRRDGENFWRGYRTWKAA